MIGKYQYEIGADKLITGMASSDYATDGVLSPSSYGLNPFVKPGVIRTLAAPTTVTSPIVGNIIASAEDSPAQSVIPSYDRVFVDDVANYYVITTAGTVTKKKTGVATTKYVSGKTDMVAFNGNTYTTLSDDISIFNTAANTFTESWWVTTKGQSALLSTVPHPMLVYQGFNWVADGNIMNNWDAALTVSANVLLLNGNEVINALGIDPTTGLMMISVQTLINATDTLSSRYFVYLWDGISSKPLRKIQVDDMVTAFYNIGGTVYVGFGLNLGQWNGNGITFLRKLQNALFAGPESYVDLPYKHHFANTRNILHVIDGTKVLSYGEVVAGKKAFFYTAYNTGASPHNLSTIFPLGSYKLGITHATGTLRIFDFNATTVGPGSLYTSNIYFPRPVFIRRVRIITRGLAASNTMDVFTIITESGVEYQSGSSSAYVSGTATKYVFDFDFGCEVMGIQLRHQYQGIVLLEHVRFIIYYDIAQ